ncbi:MAG: hypothetical protein A2020_08680 [Lentisphaerae bacterium GWF2_45_14]|nr:MAG: hypothetical protein A2020_08680 [Lentisphaerae bacterium GWF2_45_14]
MDLHVTNSAIPEFSWSFSRHSLFNHCRRAYFYRYYGAAGGRDVYSDEKKRFMYLFKHMKKTDTWLEETLRRSISSVLQKNRSSVGKDILEKHIYTESARRFFQGWNNVVAREWQSDPVKLNLFESYYAEDESSFLSSVEKLKIRLGNAIKYFTNSEIFEELSSLDFLSWKLHSKPVAFNVSGVKVWAAPDLVWADKGRIFLLDIRLSRSGGQRDERTLNPVAINLLMANHTLRAVPSRIIFRTAFLEALSGPGGIDSRGCDAVNVEELEKAVSESARAMLSVLTPDGKANEPDFPRRSGSPARDCVSCEYKLLCTDYPD